MKILELRFKNLNSLYGEWFIDFTAPEYVGSGIFALTGPTGSGKSTILDAVCLALYGATPRLGRITKSANEIMSRQTGECYAEAVFESQAGRFRCHWEQRRSRKKPDGALQFPEHQIADADTGKPLETKRSLVSGVIEDTIGMDFDRFTRSILLAQGGFDTFLKADAEQKSKILEQITGTGIYSEISRRVHERLREEREKLALLEAESSGIVILDPRQETDLVQELEDRQQQEAQLAALTSETSKAVAWLIRIEDLKKEIKALSDEAAGLRADIQAFAPQRERLAQALSAARLDGIHATLSAVRKQQADDRAALDIALKKLPELEATASKRSASLIASEQRAAQAKENLNAAVPLIRTVRSLDQRLADQKKAIDDGSAGCRTDAGKINADLELRQRERDKQIIAGKNLDSVDRYLRDHARDEWLVGGLAGLEDQLTRLDAGQKDMSRKRADRKKAETALEQAIGKLKHCTGQCVILKQSLMDAMKTHQQEKDKWTTLLDGRLLREYRAEKDRLLREAVFLARIAELEGHRAGLEDGRPCPLCGSVDHPFARGNVPVPDETEKKIQALTDRITRVEDQETVIRKRADDENTARNHLAEAEKREAEAANEWKSAGKTLSDLTGRLNEAAADFAALKRSVSDRLQPLGMADLPDAGISTLTATLKARLADWQVQVKKKADIETRMAEMNSEIKRLDAVIETQRGALAEKHKTLEALKAAYTHGLHERRALFGDKHPDHEEQGLNRSVAQAEQGEKQARNLYDESRQGLTAVKAHVDSLKGRMARREHELETLASDFTGALQTAGFADENRFIAARLPATERDALATRARLLDDGLTDLKARQKDRETRLSEELNKKTTDQSLTILEPLFREQEEQLKQLRDTMAAIRHRLTENKAALARMKEKRTVITAQTNECRRWEKLHALIGSADGKKYRTFAQGLAFEIMVSHANRQLEKMTDRYLLIRDDEQPLELNVMDNYQAGEIRSTRNLSGGESFIVSLTLALGLSKMAGRKVRVDSLFLDEGFGTLDEDALETALETLSGLHQDGKLIGVISHVSAMKERIGTRIAVTPVSGGKSAISGPGCKRVIKKE